MRRRALPPRSPSRGMTLIEVIIAIAIVSMVMAMSVRGLRAMSRSYTRDTAAKLSGAMRYLFDRASTTGKVHRLVIDFEQNRYYAEVTDDRFIMPRERETNASRAADAEARAKEAEEQKKKDEARANESWGTSANGVAVDPSRYQPEEWKPKRPKFDAFKEMVVKPVKLDRTRVLGVFTPRLAEPISTGKAYIYFFPLGFAEQAYVYVGDKKGEGAYTLVMHPLTGHVRIYNYALDPPLDRPLDDAGEAVTP